MSMRPCLALWPHRSFAATLWLDIRECSFAELRRHRWIAWNANQQCLFFSTATLTLWSPVAVGIVGAKIEAGPGLCCGDRAVPRAIETIPNSFANLRGHVRIRRSRATCARRRALCRPAVRRLRSTEPCAQTPHSREIRECKLWIGRLEKDEDRSQFCEGVVTLGNCLHQGHRVHPGRRQNCLDSYKGCAFLSLLARVPHLDHSENDSGQHREGRCNVRNGRQIHRTNLLKPNVHLRRGWEKCT